MNHLDVYYRALLDYRAQTLTRRECVLQRNAVTKVNTESDRITLKRMICTVEEDWVDAIEAGLVHIEKAIKEERQFIRSNGEVIPIEKVKHVSKDSVEHLAKHSNLITREVEGQDLIPDQLYTVEKLSDYAVYENRFLYMLLCYLRDFITLRYNKILESSNTYDANMTMCKTVKVNKQTINYEVKLVEERKDDPYLREHNEAKEIIDRIDLLLKAVLAFLSTPLMEYASKAPMLKPPITKTNVLKMNNNFKGAMALYEYVTSYDKPGYTIETRITEMNPFREQVADELAETVLLSSFLTYEYSLDIREDLQKAYEEEEKRRKEEEYQKFLEKLDKVRRRVLKSGQTPEEYIMMLEKQVRILENKCAQLDAALLEIESLKAELAAAREEIELLKARIEELEAELAYWKQKYIDDMAALKAAHEEEIRQLNEAHAAEVESLKEEIRQLIESYEEQIRQLNEAHAEEIRQLTESYEEKIRQLIEAHDEEIRQLTESYEEKINAINEAHAEEIASLNQAHAEEIESLNEAHTAEVDALNQAHAEEVATLNEEHTREVEGLNTVIAQQKEQMLSDAEIHKLEKNKLIEDHRLEIEAINKENQATVNKISGVCLQRQGRIDELIAERDALIEEKRLMIAQLYALRCEKGLKVSENDFTLKDNFDELEHEYNIFRDFYQKQWAVTKKHIRKTEMKKSKEKKTKEAKGGT